MYRRSYTVFIIATRRILLGSKDLSVGCTVEVADELTTIDDVDVVVSWFRSLRRDGGCTDGSTLS